MGVVNVRKKLLVTILLWNILKIGAETKNLQLLLLEFMKTYAADIHFAVLKFLLTAFCKMRLFLIFQCQKIVMMSQIAGLV